MTKKFYYDVLSKLLWAKNIYTHKSTLNKTLSAFKELKDEKLLSVCKLKETFHERNLEGLELFLINIRIMFIIWLTHSNYENIGKFKKVFSIRVIKIIVIQTLEKLARVIRFLLMYVLLINLNTIPLYFQQECEYYQEGEKTISFVYIPSVIK